MYRALQVTGFVLLLGMTGCLGPQTRLPSAEDIERDKDLEAVYTIGDVTVVANAAPLAVHGVGLVTDLEGTGGSPRGEYRSLLEKELRQRKIDNVARLLDSPNNALVLVTGHIQAGARKGDPIDLQVTLPRGSPATSLRGGYLQACVLRNYETTKNLNPDYQGGNRLLQGHVLAVGKGPLLVGFGNPNEKAELSKGRIWEGGSSLIERPFFLALKTDDKSARFLALKKDNKSARVTNAVAARINLKFPDNAQKQEFVHKHRQLFLLEDVTQQINDTFEPAGPGRGDAAKALSTELVSIRVPYAYRYNPERYLLVARQIPLSDDPEPMSKYRNRLQKMLANPHDCVRAALRLEALGKDSLPVLQQGLSSEEPMVRFAAAEALVYLGSTAGVEHLAQAALKQSSLRAYALIALAGLNESVCRIKLQELLAQDDPELRAGAFQALRLSYAHECRDDKELEVAMQRLGGENLQAFWLHQVAPEGAKAVNFAVTKRAEIILFGRDIVLAGRVRVRAGEEFIITADPGDDRCFVSRISQRGQQRKVSSLRLDDVLRTLVDLGGQYPEAVDLLRKLDEQQGLNCAVRRLSPPQTLSPQELMVNNPQPVPTQVRTQGGD
jgi:hypothetical protein